MPSSANWLTHGNKLRAIVGRLREAPLEGGTGHSQTTKPCFARHILQPSQILIVHGLTMLHAACVIIVTRGQTFTSPPLGVGGGAAPPLPISGLFGLSKTVSTLQPTPYTPPLSHCDSIIPMFWIQQQDLMQKSREGSL